MCNCRTVFLHLLFSVPSCVLVDIVKELLDNGADTSLENSLGEGPIQISLDNEIRLLLLGGSQMALSKYNDERNALNHANYNELETSSYASFNNESVYLLIYIF